MGTVDGGTGGTGVTGTRDYSGQGSRASSDIPSLGGSDLCLGLVQYRGSFLFIHLYFYTVYVHRFRGSGEPSKARATDILFS